MYRPSAIPVAVSATASARPLPSRQRRSRTRTRSSCDNIEYIVINFLNVDKSVFLHDIKTTLNIFGCFLDLLAPPTTQNSLLFIVQIRQRHHLVTTCVTSGFATYREIK